MLGPGRVRPPIDDRCPPGRAPNRSRVVPRWGAGTVPPRSRRLPGRARSVTVHPNVCHSPACTSPSVGTAASLDSGPMRRIRLGVLVPLVVLCALAGCEGHHTRATSSPPDTTGAGIASYTPAAGAPAFCTALARAASVRLLAPALGRLATDPWNFAATQELSAARSDLATVLDAVRRERGPAALDASLQDLVDSLGSVTDLGVSQAAERIGADLDAAGRAAQPLCGFPT